MLAELEYLSEAEKVANMIFAKAFNKMISLKIAAPGVNNKNDNWNTNTAIKLLELSGVEF